MRLRKIEELVNNKENLVSCFRKNGFDYDIYIKDDIITVEKQDLKSEKFSISSYEIV